MFDQLHYTKAYTLITNEYLIWLLSKVVKFRRRARYLEFFVQVVQKALSEGLVDIATEWCDETVNWLIRYVSVLLTYLKHKVK